MTKRPVKKKKPAPKKAPPAKKGPGRPTDWRPEYVEQCAKLAAIGWTHVQISEFLGITDRTFRRWMASKPELMEALRIPEKAANDRVTLSLYQLATGYDRWEEEIKVVNGEIVRLKVLRHYPPNASAAIFWQKSRSGWSDNPELAPAPSPEEPETQPIERESEKQIARRLAFAILQGGKGDKVA